MYHVKQNNQDLVSKYKYTITTSNSVLAKGKVSQQNFRCVKIQRELYEDLRFKTNVSEIISCKVKLMCLKYLYKCLYQKNTKINIYRKRHLTVNLIVSKSVIKNIFLFYNSNSLKVLDDSGYVCFFMNRQLKYTNLPNFSTWIGFERMNLLVALVDIISKTLLFGLSCKITH